MLWVVVVDADDLVSILGDAAGLVVVEKVGFNSGVLLLLLLDLLLLVIRLKRLKGKSVSQRLRARGTNK